MTVKKLQVEDIITLSPVQRAILGKTISGLSQAQSGQRAYRIHGALDRTRLQEAWTRLVACSSALRSSIHSEGLEKPVRVVRREQEGSLAWSDWRHVPAAGQTGRILQELRAQERESSSVENADAIHAMVAELAADEYLLICRINRLLLDECSTDILIQQLFQSYGQAGSPSRPDNFKIYLNWVNANASAADEFWRNYLRDAGDTCIAGELPGGTASDDAGRTMAYLPAGAALRFFEEHGEGAFCALVCGAWALLLRSHLGREEAIFGIATSGREGGFTGVDQVIGPLAVVLPFRAAVPAQLSIAEWLSALEKQTNEAVRHAHVMPENTDLERPLFDTAIQFLRRPLEFTAQTPAGPFSVQEITLPLPAGYPLALNVRFDRGISLEMSSNGHFEPESLGRLMSHFVGMLEALSVAPSQTCAAIQVMPEEELDQLLQWSDGGTVTPLPKTIHAGFEAQVRQTPENLAAISESGSYTYGELNRRANQLAACLRKSGVGPEAVVGVFMERCLETLTAVLAISKAGGIYLPLSPDLPQERISFLVRDAKPAVLLTRQDLISDLPLAAATAEIITLDDDWGSLNGFSAEDVESSVVPEAGAYIIYTSGSTGEPKGVVVSQAAAVHHLFAAVRAFDYSQQDRTLQFAALSFDVSIEQLLAPLMCGASVMLKDGASWSRSDFFDAVAKFEITVANVPPAFWTQLAEEDLPADLPVRLMIVGGDTMPPAAVAQWRRGPMQSIRLLNAYGPTEAVITSTVFRVSSGGDMDFQRVPIGRPLAGRKAYVILHGEQAPILMWGELHLGGPVLARGYLNRPELTAEKFIPDPFSKEPGARLYKTGDIARYLGDGQIDFLGRIDHQVKIRGFRIELGEIEHVLAEHPAVLQAVVIVREAQEGDKRLVAYVVSRAAAPPASELRDFLKFRLPEYMVPAAIEFLAALPLTPAGKVDRRALPLVGETTVADVAPPADATPAERALMAIWSDLLGVPQMSVHDDFFDLGGDSLLATQIISRVQKAFGVEVPLRLMFDSPTIAAMVREIEERGGVSVQEAEPEMTRVGDDQELLLSPAQERVWFVCREMGQSSMYNMTGAVEFEGDLDLELLEKTLTFLVRRHEALRTAFPLHDDHPVQAILPPFPVKLAVTDLSNLPETAKEDELWRLLDQESELRFDLLQGPVFRSRILRLSSLRHVLLSTVHHIAGDGWSLGVLAQEISMVYGAMLRGEGPPLPDLPFRYIDFAHWQRQLLERRRESHVDFWTNRLSGCPPPSPLPQEKSPEENGKMHGANYSVQLSPEISENLARVARDQNATLFMVLLACWKALLSSYTSSDDIVVGTDIANRGVDTEKIIGFFVNVLVLRTDLGGNPAFAELLERVRGTALAAYQHQDFPFNQVLEMLNPGWRHGQRALFKTFFHLVIGGLEVPEAPGLQITVREPDDGAAKFDLSVRVAETSQGVVCRFNYPTRLFEEAAIRQIARDYQLIVEHVAENPLTRLNVLKTMVETGAPETDVPSFKRFMTADSRS
jgi:amino acid adenylation domain-containing protein